MWSCALFCFLLITVPHEGLSGFTNGAPCSVRNTARLNKKGTWQIPQDEVDCVDITAMRKGGPLPQCFQITKATTLYADHMRLSGIPHVAMTAMPKLQLVDLSGNQLRRISKDAFLPLQNLHTLLLKDNQVFVPKRTPLLNSPYLKTLSLSNNKIRRLKPSTFKELRALTVLYLDSNWLIRLHPSVFEPMKYLKYLHLGNNRLKMMPQIVLPVPKAIIIVKGNPFNLTEVIKR